MRIVIFAGGIGTRLWPLSRENSPKQFDKIFNNASTLQLAVGRLEKDFGRENIFIQTLEKFKPIVIDQLPAWPAANILIEPERRNLGPAVCWNVWQLKQKGLGGPIALAWADHLMARPAEFVRALKVGEQLIRQDPRRFVFLAEAPRFANNNLGWIKVGAKLSRLAPVPVYAFLGWRYKPSQAECEQMYQSGEYFWNPGYFISDIDFILDKYRQLAPDIYQAVTAGNYRAAAAIHFDRAIIEKIDFGEAVVIKTNMGWSDPGTLYALKEALADKAEANVRQGKVVDLGVSDCLLYNSEEGKLLAAVGLKGMVIVNTPDALLVVPKEEVVRVTELVKKIRRQGEEKYL